MASWNNKPIHIQSYGTKRNGESAKRCNHSHQAIFATSAMLSPFSEGGFRYAAMGEYIEGPRKGQKAVCKWFKTGHVMESRFFEEDIRAMEKSVELVALWNAQGIIQQPILVNVPQVWHLQETKVFAAGLKVLVEPFIQNYEKFNSNTGWSNSTTAWPQVMQALSHFSYHASNGEYLLCDIQGAVYPKAVVLTDPAILSKRLEFGMTDLGSQGISTFFNQHRCNKYCCSHWLKPADCTKYLQPQQGTSMTVPPVYATKISCSPICFNATKHHALRPSDQRRSLLVFPPRYNHLEGSGLPPPATRPFIGYPSQHNSQGLDFPRHPW